MYFTFNNWEGGKDRDERDDEMIWFRTIENARMKLVADNIIIELSY